MEQILESRLWSTKKETTISSSARANAVGISREIARSITRKRGAPYVSAIARLRFEAHLRTPFIPTRHSQRRRFERIVRNREKKTIDFSRSSSARRRGRHRGVREFSERVSDDAKDLDPLLRPLGRPASIDYPTSRGSTARDAVLINFRRARSALTR